MPANGMYDAAGDLIDDGAYYYVYDAIGRLCASQPHLAGAGAVTGYLYDAEGYRAAKGILTIPPGAATACPSAFPASAFQPTNVYVKGPDGHTMAEFDGQQQLIRSYLYEGSRLIASEDSTGIHYQLNDWLGNRRLQTDEDGQPEGSFANLPYGESVSVNGNDSASQHFTGDERDQESGLDYATNRYYGDTGDRWTRPDPAWSLASNLSNPQTFNQYEYVLDNPLTLADPLGLCGASEGASPAGGSWFTHVRRVIVNCLSSLFGGEDDNKNGNQNSTSTSGSSDSGEHVTVFFSDHEISPDPITSWNTGMTQIRGSYFGNAVVSAGVGFSSGARQGQASITFVPTSGQVTVGLASGVGTPSESPISASLMAGTTTNLDQSGPGTTYTGGFFLGASQTYTPAHDKTTLFGIMTPGANKMSGRNLFTFYIPSGKFNINVPIEDTPNSVDLKSEGVTLGDPWGDFGLGLNQQY
jgi:RHS repeat-associated protein